MLLGADRGVEQPLCRRVVQSWVPGLMAEDVKAFPARRGRQPPAEMLGRPYPVTVFRQPKPGHLHRVVCVRILQPERAHLRAHHVAVSAHDLLPRRRIPVASAPEQISNAWSLISWPGG